MKRWIALVARLYPASWRARYGNEFQALLEDVNPGWRELFDVLGGATKMQLTTGATYLKLGAAFALAGVLIATVASFVIPKEYTSTAVMRFGAESATDSQILNDSLSKAETEVLSRTSLLKLIQDPRLDLYPAERRTQPLEGVIEYMRTRAIRIAVMQRLTSSHTPSVAFQISYRYTDRTKARDVVNRLISGLTEALIRAEMPGGKNFEILDSPSLPQFATSPKRPEILTMGLIGGLCAGLICAAFIKHPRRSFVFAAMGVVGCLLGGSLSLLIPNRYISRAVIRVVPLDSAFEESFKRIAQPGLHIQVLRTNKITNKAAVELIFVDTNPEKARLKLSAIISALIVESIDRRMRGSIEMLDDANLPLTPVYPHRYIISMLGFGAGIVIATIALTIQRIARRRESWLL
jgi:uncharacterized protein involved in exopolysaccharide biosynthesis